MTICKRDGCDLRASFNFPDKKGGIFCKSHRLENMRNVINKTCFIESCYTIPKFNYIGLTDGLYCKPHRLENMRDVVNKTCFIKTCDTRPSFNYIGQTGGLYCKTHRLKNMRDVMHKTCIIETCDTRPNFNYIEQTTGLYCKSHRLANMWDVNNRQCLYEGCIAQPSCNFPNKKIGLYCSKHKLDKMRDVINKRCISCKDIHANPKYKKHCLRCFVHLFPGEKVARNYKIKEVHVTDFIKESFKDEVIVLDNRTGGCSRRRPDCYIDKLTHVLIIECDENKHSDYETICDNKRTMELFQDFGNRPIVFIRFNPDKYIDKDGKKVESSFKTLKTSGISVIRNEKEWNTRLNILKQCMNKWLITIPDKEVTTEYLFYNALTLEEQLENLQI